MRADISSLRPPLMSRRRLELSTTLHGINPSSLEVVISVALFDHRRRDAPRTGSSGAGCVACSRKPFLAKVLIGAIDKATG